MGWKNLHPATRTGLVLAPGVLVLSILLVGPRWFGTDWIPKGASFYEKMSKGIVPLIVVAFGSFLVSPLLLWGLVANRSRQNLLTLARPLLLYLLCIALHGTHLLGYGLWRTGKADFANFRLLMYYAAFLGVAFVIHLLLPPPRMVGTVYSPPPLQ